MLPHCICDVQDGAVAAASPALTCMYQHRLYNFVLNHLGACLPACGDLPACEVTVQGVE